LRPRFPKALLVGLDAFVAVTAIGGGIALTTGLEDERFPTSWLDGTPFTSYLVPGVILAVVVGGSAALATVAVWRNPRTGGALSVLAGAALVGQIIGEILLLTQPGQPTATELVYLTIGVLMAALGLLFWHEGRPSAAVEPPTASA